MIKNEKEYAVAKAELESFLSAFNEFDVVGEEELGIDPVIARAQRASYARKIDDLRAEIRVFERLVSGKMTDLPVVGLADLGKALIAARLASGLSQRALGELAGLKEQQIQRYEKESYSTANVRRLALIADALGVSFDGSLKTGGASVESDLPLRGFSASHFPFSVMKKRGWFDSKTTKATRLSIEEKRAALVQFLDSCPVPSGAALHRKTDSFVSNEREAGLLAWQSRVLSRALAVCHQYPRFQPFSSDVVNRLAKLSSKQEGLRELIDILGKHGVILIFEPHLPKTKIDGAALSLDGRWAVIGMSVRFDRIDNFWFVVLHEIGHLMRHWPYVKMSGIIDEDAGHEAVELIEREADEFAENAILASSVWKNSIVRYSQDPEQIKVFAAKHSLHPALVAGRIRRERSYTEFSDLVNGSRVRSQLKRLGVYEEAK